MDVIMLSGAAQKQQLEMIEVYILALIIAGLITLIVSNRPRDLDKIYNSYNSHFMLLYQVSGVLLY